MTIGATAAILVGEWLDMCEEAELSGELVVWYAQSKRAVALAVFVEASELRPIYFRPTGTGRGDLSHEDARRVLMPLWRQLTND